MKKVFLLSGMEGSKSRNHQYLFSYTSSWNKLYQIHSVDAARVFWYFLLYTFQGGNERKEERRI